MCVCLCVCVCVCVCVRHKGFLSHWPQRKNNLILTWLVPFSPSRSPSLSLSILPSLCSCTWFPLLRSHLCLSVTNMTHKKASDNRNGANSESGFTWYWGFTHEPQGVYAGSGRTEKGGGGGGDHSLFLLFHVAFSLFKKLSGRLLSSCVIVILLRWIFCLSGGRV